MSDNDLTDEDLLLVARHGSGILERSLATVLYCKRKGELDRLRALVDDTSDEEAERE